MGKKTKIYAALAELQRLAAEEGPLYADTPSTGGAPGERVWYYASTELVESRVGKLLPALGVGLMLLPPEILSEADRVRVRWTIVHKHSGQTLDREQTLPLTLDKNIREINAAIATVSQCRRWLLLWMSGLQPLQRLGVASQPADRPIEGHKVDVDASSTRPPEELAAHVDEQLARSSKQGNVVPLVGEVEDGDDYEYLVPDVEDIGEDDDTEAVDWDAAEASEANDWVTSAARAYVLSDIEDIEIADDGRIAGADAPVDWSHITDVELADATCFYQGLVESANGRGPVAQRLVDLKNEAHVRAVAAGHDADASNTPAFIPATPTWSELTDLWSEYVKTTEPDNGPWLSTPLKRTLAGFIKAVLDLPKKPASPTRDQVERVRRALNRYIGKAKQ